MQQAAIPLNSFMIKDKSGQILLTPKASYAYWKQAIEYARAVNMQEMTMEEFNEFLKLVDHEKLSREHAAEYPTSEHFQIGQAGKTFVQRISAKDNTKACNIKKNNPAISHLSARQVVNLPNWNRYNSMGILDGKQNKKKQP
jgi:hypothetical protein